METHNQGGSADSDRLPLVVFNDRALVLRDEAALAERIHAATPLRGLVRLGERRGFFHRNAVLQLGGLTLSSSVHAPLVLEAEQTESAMVALAYVGSARVTIQQQRFDLLPQQGLLYLPGAAGPHRRSDRRRRPRTQVFPAAAAPAQAGSAPQPPGAGSAGHPAAGPDHAGCP